MRLCVYVFGPCLCAFSPSHPFIIFHVCEKVLPCCCEKSNQQQQCQVDTTPARNVHRQTALFALTSPAVATATTIGCSSWRLRTNQKTRPKQVTTIRGSDTSLMSEHLNELLQNGDSAKSAIKSTTWMSRPTTTEISWQFVIVVSPITVPARPAFIGDL